jgi:multisubunit Na+/H+ antiporter MnhF subunit
VHSWLLIAASVWVTGLLAVLAGVALRTRTSIKRLIVAGAASLLLAALLTLLSLWRQESWYLDAALVLALLSFLEVVAASRYLDPDRRPF